MTTTTMPWVSTKAMPYLQAIPTLYMLLPRKQSSYLLDEKVLPSGVSSSLARLMPKSTPSKFNPPRQRGPEARAVTRTAPRTRHHIAAPLLAAVTKPITPNNRASSYLGRTMTRTRPSMPSRRQKLRARPMQTTTKTTTSILYRASQHTAPPVGATISNSWFTGKTRQTTTPRRGSSRRTCRRRRWMLLWITGRRLRAVALRSGLTRCTPLRATSG
jgi:hypothetical protein